jgi:hypothetical protein
MTARRLRFEASAASPSGEDRVVVLDTAWTPQPGDERETVRDAAGEVLSARDLYDEALALLDAWAERSGIVDLMMVDGTSLWYQRRLSNWWWLQERLLWLGILDVLIASERPTELILGQGVDAALTEVVGLVSARDRLPFQGPPEEAPGPAPDGDRRAAAGGGTRRPVATRRRFLDRLRERWWPERHERRLRLLTKRLERLAAEPPALLVLLEHARQQVRLPAGGVRLMNPYIDPILDELSSAGLDHTEMEIIGSIDQDELWQRVSPRSASRVLAADVLRMFDRPGEHRAYVERAEAIATQIESIDTPIVVDGIDFGPLFVARLADYSRLHLRGRIRHVVRIRRLLEKIRPLGILLADEYNRTDWLGAARAQGVPTIAVQHGGIQRRHPGYIHRSRPPGLTLPDRTFLFGDWERRLLVGSSVYHQDELRVSGSPRLDLVREEVTADRDAVRRELGLEPTNRMLVLSTTWGQLARRFHFMVTLARLFDRPIRDVHLVIKLHPGEPDDGLYRRVIEGVAAASGFDPVPLSVVHRVDLYRLLAAADAHLGVFSTVITEAVFTGTPNLLAACVRPSDLLGYVEAGVAFPVRDGAELEEALRTGAGRSDQASRDAFIRDHFEPGNASRKIGDDLVAWLRRA